jgi:hypothetical protein
MKTIAALALFCAFSDMAFAQSPECPPSPGAGDLLACYNRIAPPPKLRKRATSKVPTAQDWVNPEHPYFQQSLPIPKRDM